jgi:hypothetical protein
VDYLDGFEEEELDGDEEFLRRARTADEGAAAERTLQVRSVHCPTPHWRP